MSQTKTIARKAIAIRPEVKLPPTNDDIMQANQIERLASLNCNENPLGTAPLAIKAIEKELGQLNRYPESGSTLLRGAIATHYGLGADNVIISNGGDNIITTLMAGFIDPEDEIIAGDPSFFVYGLSSSIMGGKLVSVRLKNMVYDLEGILKAITPKTKMIVVCNPNNPTSTIVSKREVEDFLAKVPDNVLVVMDEAYAEFVNDENYPDSIEYIKAGKNILVIRTFSKLYGLAGVRVGYALAPKPIIANLRKVIETFPVNRVAQAGAMAALGDGDFVAKVKAYTEESRGYLNQEFRAMGMEPVASFANFMFVDLKTQAAPIVAELEKRGILIKAGVAWGFPTYARISFGIKEENQWLIKELKAIISK